VNEAAADVNATLAAGFEALRRSDPRAAREAFTRVIAARRRDASAWYGLSLVHRSLGSAAEEHAALDQALGVDPRHVPALIAKGDLYVRGGDLRAATSYYLAVLKLAAALQSVPPELRPELQRIEALCKRFEREYETHLVTAVGNTGVDPAAHPRFMQALDLLLGKRQIFLQQPRYFFFPELPQIQFFDRQQFPWVASLEAQTAAIREELAGILATGGAGFVPYIQSEADRPNFSARGLLNNPDWSACYLIKNGVEVAENAARCPQTMAALRDVPLCRIPGRTPSVHFSLLRPGTRIHPHHGFMNTRLICHLPLIVPGHCTLRVGNETRSWREGEVLIFDDTIEHEAWNSSQEPRAILILDIWNPLLTSAERALVCAATVALNEYYRE
jgi:aspartate beta-hydroxylase